MTSASDSAENVITWAIEPNVGTLVPATSGRNFSAVYTSPKDFTGQVIITATVQRGGGQSRSASAIIKSVNSGKDCVAVLVENYRKDQTGDAEYHLRIPVTGTVWINVIKDETVVEPGARPWKLWVSSNNGDPIMDSGNRDRGVATEGPVDIWVTGPSGGMATWLSKENLEYFSTAKFHMRGDKLLEFQIRKEHQGWSIEQDHCN